MNPGGIRADLAVERRVGHLRRGVLGAAVQQLRRLDGHDRRADPDAAQPAVDRARTPAARKILQVSGITYIVREVRHDVHAQAGHRAGQRRAARPRRATYRVVANSFLSDGGDGFAAFAQRHEQVLRRPRHRRVRALPRAANDPYTPVATDRITVVP